MIGPPRSSTPGEADLMTPEQIDELNRARESLMRRRSEIAKRIAEAPLVSVESAEEITKIQHAIEAVDRTLNEAGHPYMNPEMAGEAAASSRRS
jgi:hypothetical protein